MSVHKQRNKPLMTKEFVIVLRVSLDKLNEWISSLGRVMAKLPHTSLTAIALTFLVMNLSTMLSQLFCVFLCHVFKITSFFASLINKGDFLVNYRQHTLIFFLAWLPLNSSQVFSPLFQQALNRLTILIPLKVIILAFIHISSYFRYLYSMFRLPWMHPG